MILVLRSHLEGIKMDNKNILIFLLILLIYINVYMPLAEKNQKLVHNIASVKKSINKDRYYIAHKAYIYQELNTSNTINHTYTQKYLFSEDSAMILNIIQKRVKQIIKDTHVNEDLITWGEQYTDKKYFEIFPMQLRVSGSVKHLGEFFDKLYHTHKIKIKEFSMERTPEHYILRISVFGVKKVEES